MSPLFFLLLVPLGLIARHVFKRTRTISPTHERVVILGASSGIGRAIALVYAARGACLLLVARRSDKLDAVRNECAALSTADVLSYTADFTDPDALLAVRDRVETAWSGLDTLVVCAGVAAVQPVLAIAASSPASDGLARVHSVAAAALRANFDGPLLSATTFIPLLTRSSACPAVLLVSSVAALIPAPTRALYGASKAAALLLFRALALEHPEIRFTAVLPSSVEGDFRASSVDGVPVSPPVSSRPLRVDYVARECVRAVDYRIRTLWLPPSYRYIHLLSCIFPSLVDAGARSKYNFPVPQKTSHSQRNN